MPASNEMIHTDVLVIGGGIGGMCAAIKAAEQKANVLVAEKADPRWGGQLPFSGGAFMCLFPDDDRESWIRGNLEDGNDLNDRRWLLKFGEATYQRMHDLMNWGVPFKRDMKGEFLRLKRPTHLGSSVHVTHPKLVLPVLAKTAFSKGVKILNKTYIPDVLIHDDRVIGAVGFNLITGNYYTILAKTTIIASGACNYGIRRLFNMDYGEGVLMAYKAGAEMRNAEFGNQYTPVEKESETWTWSNYLLENADGEKIIEKHYPGSMREKGFQTIASMYREIEAGKGPIFQNFSRSPEFVDKVQEIGGIEGYNVVVHCLNKGMDLSKERIEMKPSLSGHMGPIKVDLNCETTVPGLFAIGDASFGGSAFQGTLPAGSHPSYPLPFAVVSGCAAGETAGKKAPGVPKPKAIKAEIEKSKAQILAPLKAKRGLNPYDAIRRIQEVISPLKYNFIKSGDRLKEALSTIEAVKKDLPKLKAKDAHELMRVHEARSMTLCAELQYAAGLMRTESRGGHIREDYPERDDKNWLKWIEIKRDDDKMKLWTTPVPNE